MCLVNTENKKVPKKRRVTRRSDKRTFTISEKKILNDFLYYRCPTLRYVVKSRKKDEKNCLTFRIAQNRGGPTFRAEGRI